MIRRLFAFAALFAACAGAQAGEVAKGQLDIIGLSLEVERATVTTGVDIPSNVQTIFGGKQNDEAPSVLGLSVLGELTGPGILTPITLVTSPGRAFSIPALHDKGDYALQNVRLVGANGEFLQQAIPSFAVIRVADILQTEVRVRQLTADELRARGITVDARNFDVYEYSFVFGVEGQQIIVPYPVIVDRRTHTITPVEQASPYKLPPLNTSQQPPRFTPPEMYPMTFEEIGGSESMPEAGGATSGGTTAQRPSIPAALVVPSGFGVLHQFFAVILQVDNASPDSKIRLDAISATINAPSQLRVAKVMPAVALGQPVPIYDSGTSTTYLVAGASGKAEWTLEALKAGTHAVDIEVLATYQKEGQADVPMRGRVSTSLVVSDPRFQINFSHPDVVRKDETYTAYAFVTNLSPQRQHVVLDTSAVPPCSSGAAVENICRLDANGIGGGTFELDVEPGQMLPVPYKLKSDITGHVFAAAGSANDETLGVSVRLSMGVSASGIPLSPATLVMPHYAQYLPTTFINDNLQLLGLGYSLATAPLNASTAKFPRVIKTDVFQQAQAIARAGQRVFITTPAENRDAWFHLGLDLLGNVERVDQLTTAPELREWDQLRRMESSGRRAGAAIAHEFERVETGRTAQQFVDDFAAATSHRSPFFFACAESSAMKITGLTTGATLDATTQNVPYGELTTFNGGALAMIGRWKEDLRLTITSPTVLHLIWPDTPNGAHRRDDITITAPTTIDVHRGAGGTLIPLPAIRILGAAQDLFLDNGGHLVSILFNRPVTAIDRDKLALTINVPKASYSVTRRNVAGQELQIPGAALQEDGKILNASFDKTLSRNATYTVTVDSVGDVVPRIDNDRPGAILTGKVLRANNTPIAGAVVAMTSNNVAQFDVADANGRFLYEFVPRDIDSGISGHYDLSCSAEGKITSLEGTVRLPGEVHTANLVFLGRGSATGVVRYSDGVVVPNARVTVGSTMFNQYRTSTSDASGRYTIDDLPVGPLTFAVVDASGRPTYAANQIRTPGEVVTQDLVIQKKDAPGSGSVRVRVRRSDTNALVSGAHVGVFSQGYGLQDGFTDGSGFIEFTRVPAGLISILASEWSITRESIGIELDLRADQLIDQTLTLRVPTASDPPPGTLEGTITRDDPAAPSDVSRDAIVAGAIVSIQGLPPVTAAADGTYTYPDVPLIASNRTITVFDPVTGRRGAFSIPTLQSGGNHFSMKLSTAAPEGIATMRVRLYDSRGVAVTGYRVISPGFPPTNFEEKGNGVYELANVRVPAESVVVGMPKTTNGPYGDQAVEGRVRVDFHGQVGVADLRLPGQGKVIAKLEIEQSCTTPPCYAQVIGPAAITYAAWDEREQSMGPRTIEVAPDAATGLVTFDKVPARQNARVETVRNPVGYATTTAYLAYDGDVRQVSLQMKDVGDVTGRVLMHDRQTPISGAAVRLTGGNATYAPQITAPDGSFRFPGVGANIAFRLTAEYATDGVYRTGFVDAATPQGGGPVGNLVIVMREQSAIEGQVVDAANAPVPLAKYWARELAWPYRSFGSSTDPLQCDLSGRFLITNVFTGPFRITAVSPQNQEACGDYQGTLAEEGDTSQRSIRIAIGGAGVGAVSVTVVDPLQAFIAVPNAEIALYRNETRFDFTTTDDKGVAYFDQIPAGTYRVTAYSKGLGRAGTTASFAVSADQTSSQRIQLELRGTVSGSVSDPESEPTPDAAVKGAPVQLDSRAITTRASTDSDGKFEFLGVPEGDFRLTAFDLDSGRIGNGPAGLFISSLITEQKNIQIALERFGSLNVKAYLPNDAGGPGQLAPLVDVALTIKYSQFGSVFTTRGAQGPGDVTFRRLLPRWYDVTVRELGGEYRTARTSGTFDTLSKSASVVFPQSGSVEVTVVDGTGHFVGDALVDINGRKLYTPASGIVTLSGLPLGWISVYARKDNVSASAGGNLATRAEPLRLTLNLGSRIVVAGHVEAETGIGVPSIGTRVLMNVTSSLITGGIQRLETLTDANGDYAFNGIPVSNTTLDLKFYGPDDTTIGATYAQSVANGTTGTVTIPTKKLDATPPRVLTIDPPVNATSVSPSATLSITFSEPIASSFLTTTWFQLIATDTNAIVNVAFQPSVRPDGTYIVKLIPPPAPPSQNNVQKFALKSNTLYRLALPQGIQDTTGNAMRTAVGSNFTTLDYAEPAVVRIEPSETTPIPSNATFRVKFNKSIDITSFDEGNGGVLKLEQLDAYRGSVIAPIPTTRYLDTIDPTTVVVAPNGVAIAESSFYRLTISGTRDTQTPANIQKDPRVADFFSFDTKKPVVHITSPSTTTKLVQGVLYTATVEIDDTDIATVDFFDANDNLLKRIKAPPFAYSFVASGTSMTLKASATDLSGNTSAELAVATWEVVPNNAPANIVVANAPESAYPTGAIATNVSFEDEGVSATVAIELHGTRHSDNTPFTQILGSKNVTRISTAVPFAAASFNYSLPLDLKAGAAEIVATVTDSLSKSATASGALTITADTTAPVVVSLLPKSETHYQFNQTYTIEFKVRDAETGLKSATISVGGVAQSGVTSAFDATTGIRTYRKDILVPPKNADTRVVISATATDNRDNATTATTEVIYDHRDDATLPRAAWITPLDGAALPAGQTGWLTTLRVKATDDTKVTAVRFESTALASPVIVTTPNGGTTDVFETKAALAMTAGTPFVITAIVSDGDPSHDVELPITIDPIALAQELPAIVSANVSITSSNVDQYRNKSLAVRGPNSLVYITVPIELKDLILLDGAALSTLEETKLDVTVSDHLFVDADSKVDVTGRGYLGGWRSREDNSVHNESAIGRSLVAGAVSADASYGGIGGSLLGVTNATYGSITEPVDFGSGGAGSSSGAAGSNGGGAVSLKGGRFAIAGAVRADGGASGWAHGSGGSVLVDARTLITGAVTRVTANGGDGSATNNSDAGGGGGRMSIRVADRLDLDAALPVFQARGGRNGGVESTTYVDGGAGTIHLLRPGAALGELIVSNYDERYPATVHLSAGTPVWTAATPVAALDAAAPAAVAGAAAERAAAHAAAVQTFAAFTIGPRALAVFDDALPTALTIDPSAKVIGPTDLPAIALVSTTPAANANVPQASSISARYTASSIAGVREVRTILAAQPNDVAAYPGFVANIAESSSSIAIPATANTGATTLKIRVTDRAGRTAEIPAVAFNVIANTPPVIDTFDVVPADESYAGHSLAVTAAAHDDVAVTSLTLASSAGTVSGSFNVAIPATTPSNTDVVLTLSASDGFPGRAATTATKTIKVKKDLGAPTMSVIAPQSGAEIQEAANATFTVDVTAADAEVGVKSVVARFEGVDRTLALAAGHYTVAIPVPSVDGTERVPKTLAITVSDYEGNVTTTDVVVYIKPLIDPNAPAIDWVCTSPGAMYPAGFAVPIKFFAKGNTSSNAVQTVSVTIDGVAQTVSSAGTDQYQATFTIPASAAAGTTYNVRVAATSVAGNEATLVGTITVTGGTDITTASTIDATDAAFENLSFVVRSGGTLTIIGPHHFANIAVMSGGKLVQQHVDLSRADQISVDRLYVACGATIDVTKLGYGNDATAPGAGWADDWSGGSHIGSGAIVIRAAGGTFGSVYRPAEMGGSGHTDTQTTTPGGGAVRIAATGPIAMDGSVFAASGTVSTAGTGAGGSVWLSTASTMSGAGSIDASGGNANCHGAGGGGAIALEYATASGTMLTKLTAFGGSAPCVGRPAAAGSIYKRGASSTYGDLTIAANTTSLYSATILPSLGRRVAASVNGSSVTLAGNDWLPSSLAGHWIRVIAPDGTMRGTWRIASIANHASARTWTGAVDVKLQDALAYDGYVIYSDAGLGFEKRRWAGARFNNGLWQYDNDSAFVNFTPAAGDVIVASFSKDATRITDLRRATCCAAINGIPVAGMISGEMQANGVATASLTGAYDASELFISSDGRNRGIVLSGGAPTITFEGTPVIQPGDALQGVYRFDNVSLTNARVITNDLIEIGQLTKDTASSVTSGNTAAPVLGGSLSIVKGLDGPSVTGTASDADGVDAVARVASVTPAATPLENAVCVMFDITPSLAIRRSENGRAGSTSFGNNCGVSTTRTIGANGAVAFSASQTNKEIQAGLVVNDTTRDFNEPNHNSFRLKTTGTYEIWANGTNANKNGSYTSGTVFRIEKTATAIRWIVDGVRVHESTTNVPATSRFDVAFISDSGELRGIEYEPASLDLPAFRAGAAADGSFKIPLRARPGDAILVKARDRHRNPLESSEIAAGTIPADYAITSLTFSPVEVTGGRTATGTVTLASPAGTDGARIDLTSLGATVSVPASLTIAAGQTSGTFAATTSAVTSPADVAIVASWGGITQSGTLRVVKDNLPPTIAITSPAASTQYTEGSSTTRIAVQVNAADADSGLLRVYATLNGVETNLAKDTTKGPDVWTAQITPPFVDGTQPLSFTLIVTAVDNNANATSASVTIIVNPLIDPSLPTVAWSCSPDAMYPAGSVVTLRAIATQPNANNPIQLVRFDIEGQPSLNATNVGGNTWEAQWTLPNADASYNVTAFAKAAGDGTSAAIGHIGAVVIEQTFSSSTTIGDASYDNKSIAVTAGTLTLSGTHTFRNLLILGGSVTHPSGSSLTLNVTNALHVACGASIDVIGKGFAAQTTYSGATAAGFSQGGSHMGVGGPASTTAGFTYGSVVKPQEPGAGGGSPSGRAGGGVLRINAGSVVLNGTITATGDGSTASGIRGGAGGSIWLTTSAVSGTGSVEASGGAGQNSGSGAGGGGAIAIEYATGTISWTLKAEAGANSVSTAIGGAGTIYVKGPNATFGDLRVDTGTTGAGQPTVLPALGNGFAIAGTGGASLVTDRSVDIPSYFIGHWIEIRNASGVLKGTWMIASIDPANKKKVVLAQNASESIDVVAGDTWQGVYRFDNLIAPNTVTITGDPIRIMGVGGNVTLTGPANGTLTMLHAVSGTNVTVGGNVVVGGISATTSATIASGSVATSSVTAPAIIVKNGATLTSSGNGATPLTVDASGTLTVEAGGAISAIGKGYAQNQTYSGASFPSSSQGGSHLGLGAPTSTPTGFTFGSVVRPQEAGGGGGSSSGRSGGGALKINAGSIALGGTISATGDGSTASGARGGAGGSVWIVTGAISGTGSVEASGGAGQNSGSGAGGGGAIAIEHASATMPWTLKADAGINSVASAIGGAGTIFVKGPNATFGDLRVESGTTAIAPQTILPALGFGIAQNGTTSATLMTDRTLDIPAYFVGHWVEIASSSGAPKGKWKIASVLGKSATLAPNSGETISLQPGDQWAGLYRFDNAKLRNATLVSADRIAITNAVDKDTASTMPNQLPPLFDPALLSQIVVSSGPLGDSITAPAGAVGDAESPVTLTATNRRTFATFVATAAANGSFSIPVQGQAGDTFTLRATDAHASPRTSFSIDVNGAIVETNSIASIDLQPSTVTGAASVTGTVRLQYPARSAGVTVALTSSNPSVASVPASITIAGGTIAAQFTIATTAPASSTSATITATLATSLRSATLNVLAGTATLTDLTVSPSSLEGGASTNGTITLGAAAPAGGATVILTTSNSSIASVPSTIVVPAGSTTTTFTIATSKIAAATNASITATYGATRNATLSLTACSAMTTAAPIAIVPSPLWFDDAPPSGGTVTGSASFDATQAASGTQSLHFAAATGARTWTVTGGAPFAVTTNDRIVIHALINPCNPPRQIWITLSDGTTSLHASWGESLIDPKETAVRIGALPTTGVWTRLEVSANVLGLTSTKNFTSFQAQVYGGEAWIDAVGLASCAMTTVAAPTHRSDEVVWFDDALPAGAVAQSGGTARTWVWDVSQAASGTASHTDTLEPATHQHGFTGATQKLDVVDGDVLFAWVLIDPCNPPKQILISYASGTDWAHGAFWGENLILPGTRIPQNSRIGVMPEAGRWVRLEIPAALVNLEGFSIDGIAFAAYGGRAWFDRAGKTTRVNLARNKTATQSSTSLSYSASRANDGDRSGAADNWSATNSEAEPWWQVDLGDVQPIEDIELWPRPGCCAITNFTVYVSDVPFASTRSAIDAQSGIARLGFSGTAVRPTSLRVDRTGRFVRIYVNGTTQLQLADVAVWAPLLQKRVNLAIGQPSARQSSTLTTWPALSKAENAVNGDLCGVFAERGSTTHTNVEANAWWDVDLGSVSPISEVDVIMRANSDANPVAAGDEVTNFYVFVSDQPFASTSPATTIAQAGVSTYFYGTPPRSSYPFVINRTGRYVRVQISSTWVVFLNEVQIWSQDALLRALKNKVSE